MIFIQWDSKSLGLSTSTMDCSEVDIYNGRDDGMERSESNFICLSFVHNFCNVWTVLSPFLYIYLFYSLSCHLYLSSSYVFVKLRTQNYLFSTIIKKNVFDLTHKSYTYIKIICIYPKNHRIKDVLLSCITLLEVLVYYAYGPRRRRRIQYSSVSRHGFFSKFKLCRCLFHLNYTEN